MRGAIMVPVRSGCDLIGPGCHIVTSENAAHTSVLLVSKLRALPSSVSRARARLNPSPVLRAALTVVQEGRGPPCLEGRGPRCLGDLVRRVLVVHREPGSLSETLPVGDVIALFLSVSSQVNVGCSPPSSSSALHVSTVR
ncbi:unnamed protein product [Boreogadus saida]